MKRKSALTLLSVLLFALYGCGEATIEENTQLGKCNLDNAQSLDKISYYVDSKWDVTDAPNGVYYYPFESNNDGFLFVSSATMSSKIDMGSLSDDNIKELTKSVADGISENSDFVADAEPIVSKLLGYPLSKIAGSMTMHDGKYGIQAKLIFTSSQVYSFIVVQKGKLSEEFSNALNAIVKTIKLEDAKIYDSFDDYAMDVFLNDGVCDVVSHETNQNDDGTYAWKVSVENVLKPDDLMISAGSIGMAMNPTMQETLFKDGMKEISVAAISIDGESGATIILLPPIRQENVFLCTFAARDTYAQKEVLQAAYNTSILFQHDMQNVLNMATN